MPLSGKELVKMFLKKGWKLERIKGSHHVLVYENETVVIPVHGSRDLKNGLERALLKKLNQGKLSKE